MSLQFKSAIFTLFLSAFISAFVFAADRGTAEEAKALLTKAIAHYKEVGRKQAFADFMSKKAPWLDRDLYVACSDSSHVLVANGAYPQYVGTSLDMTKALNGKPLGKAFWDAAETGETVDWMWMNPVTNKFERKAGIAQKADSDITCTVGYYKPSGN